MYDRNTTAFLGMIAKSEGTYGVGDDGYNVLVGSTAVRSVLFHNYADHPRLKIEVRRDNPTTPEDEQLVSTAAGRYQILARTFDAYRERLNLKDFSPMSQDAIAVQLIKERGAYGDVLLGHVAGAIEKCANIWASLPGAGYGQRENKLERCLEWYAECGGVLADD